METQRGKQMTLFIAKQRPAQALFKSPTITLSFRKAMTGLHVDHQCVRENDLNLSTCLIAIRVQNTQKFTE